MQEGGSLVPLIINWPGVIKTGSVSKNLVDAADFVPTFAEIAGARLPNDKKLDGVSFAKQIKGAKGNSRDWIFTGLGNDWYVRSADWKLNRAGQLFDMRKAPFEEILTPDSEGTKSIKEDIQKVLAELDPASGYLDRGDGSGRHANKAAKKAKKN